MNGPLRFLVGSYRVFFCAPTPETLLNATHRARIPVWGIRREGDTLSFSVSASDRDRVTALVPDDKKEALSLREEGSLILRRRFGKRMGLILGLTLFLVLSFLSTLFVWSVEVEGNVLLSDRELRQRLAEVGVTSGRLLSGIDTAEVALQLRVNHSDLAHASLNLIGTRAVLSVREREPVPREEASEGETANLVADVGGRILRYEVLSGKAMITRGEEVQKGALLVSGVLERPNGAFTTVRASGRVFAQTERCFEVTVPLEQTATVFTGREREASAYELLGMTLSPPGFEDCGFEDFEEIWSEEPVTLFGRELPILCRTVTRCEREEKKSTITVDRAEDLAYDKYEEYKRDTLLYGYEILEENLQIRACEEGVTLTAELVLVEDIARSLPFLLLEKGD